MMSEQLPPVGRVLPFPWRCVQCREKEVYPLAIDYTRTVKHDGLPYTVHVPDLEIPTCRNCGERVFTAETEDRVIAALRKQAGLLTPPVMQQWRSQLQLSQEEVGEQLGVTKEMIFRWETGAMIQSRAMDKQLRLFFGSEEVRRLLRHGFVADMSPTSHRTRVA
jgi:putative zinc finger/helix-turn-helix YgiT family protein